jgi:subtilisin family serine protease
MKKSSSQRNRHRRRLGCLVAVLALLGSRAPIAGIVVDKRAPARVRADALHAEGITGRGVTIAVVDGVSMLAAERSRAADGHHRLLAVYDAVSGQVGGGSTMSDEALQPAGAEHLIDAMLSSRRKVDGGFEGIAPDADLVLVKALAADGTGRSTDVIRALRWVVANRDRYGIRVLNLSLVAPARPRFWEDPLNQAVMDAWRAGIVVVAAAGNGGPAPATIAAPGNVPHVITVGADAARGGEGLVPSYSAAGPTADGFVKPEIIAPSGALAIAPVPAGDGPIRRPPAGTSVSAAIVSGVVALVLETSPWLTPDQVKHRLVTSGRSAVAPSGDVYPILRQGAGLVDALAAARGLAAADPPLDSDHDLSGFAWSERTASGYSWSDGSIPTYPLPEEALRGLLWSD